MMTVKDLRELLYSLPADAEISVVFDSMVWPIDMLDVRDEREIHIRVDYAHPR